MSISSGYLIIPTLFTTCLSQMLFRLGMVGKGKTIRKRAITWRAEVMFLLLLMVLQGIQLRCRKETLGCHALINMRRCHMPFEAGLATHDLVTLITVAVLNCSLVLL